MSGGDHATGSGFVGRARATAGALPSKIDEQIKRNPYLTIGIATAVGAGFGIVLSSRVLRAVITAVATASAAELARSYFRKNAWVRAS
jgi:hypothetical protein